MLNKKVEEALNAQINAEMWSAYLYLSMAAYCHANGNPGMGNWFQVQFQEEQDHAKIMFNYIIQRGGHVELKAIDAVPTTWENPLDVFESTLAHEQKVTSLINNNVTLFHSKPRFSDSVMPLMNLNSIVVGLIFTRFTNLVKMVPSNVSSGGEDPNCCCMLRVWKRTLSKPLSVLRLERIFFFSRSC